MEDVEEILAGESHAMRRELKTKNALMADWGKQTEEAIFIRTWDSATVSYTTWLKSVEAAKEHYID